MASAAAVPSADQGQLVKATLGRLNRTSPSWAWPVGAAVLAISGLLVYGLETRWGMVEAVRFLIGVVLLWGPLCLVVSTLLRAEVADRAARWTLAATGSYALTTLLYFALAVVDVPWLLVPVLSLAVLSVLPRLRWRWTAPKPTAARVVVMLLVVVSLLTCANYQQPFSDPGEAGERRLLVSTDYLYHSGLIAELDRHTPPLQAAARAGTPERPYHLFPHLTTMLMARFTGQREILRTHLVYHLVVIEVLVCLSLFCVGRRITRRRAGGYALVALMYPLAVTWPPLLSDTTASPPIEQFYFTLLPHASSGLEPVALVSSQMYSGIVVLLGVLLALIVLVDRDKSVPMRWLPLLIGLMVAAEMRFRIQFGLVLLPVFLMVLWFRRRTRSPWFLAAALTAVVTAVLLLLETRSSRYLSGASGVHLRYNGLTQVQPDPRQLGAFINSWPFSGAVHRRLQALLSGSTFDWAWQGVSMSAFSALNVVGFPLMVTTAFALARGLRVARFLASIGLVMVILSVVLAVVLDTDYDHYSLGGQMLLSTRWFLFPLAAVPMASAWRYLDGAPRLRPAAIALAVVAVAIGFVARLEPSPLRSALRSSPNSVAIIQGEWDALKYLRERAPPTAVLMSSEHTGYEFVFTGLTGRRAYLEGSNSIVDAHAARTYPHDNRPSRINEVWSTADSERFCRLLQETPVTHLVEYARQPLRVTRSSCTEQEWRSRDGQVTIWRLTGR